MMLNPLLRPLIQPFLRSAKDAFRRGGVPDPFAPVNTVAPTIQGTPAVYQTLTVNNGSWSGYPSPSFTYQWRNAGVDIGGATGSSYVVLEGDYTDSITVFVTGTNAEGSANGTSAAVVIAGAAPVNTVAPIASGGTGLGDAISTTAGTWTGYPTPTITYQATRNGVAIDGVTANTRNVAVADSSASMGWLVTASNAAGSASAPSNTITAQTFTAPEISGNPTITGTVEVGETVTFVPAAVTGNPTPTRTWQPMSDGVDFGAAQSGDTYVIPAGIGGTDFGVRQIETNSQGTSFADSSAVAVPEPAFSPASLPNSSVFDPSIFSTLFQDAAQAVPVTAVGQPVRVIRDTTARARHLIAASDAARPTLAQDGSGRYYLNFPSITVTMSAAATLNIGTPSMLSVLATLDGGAGTDISPLMAIEFDNTNAFRLGVRPSISAIRAFARVLSKGVTVSQINGNTGDYVNGAIGVHHATVTSGLLARGLEAADTYSMATPWTTETLDNATLKLGGPPPGGTAGNAFKFYGGVVAIGAADVAAKANIISWLQAKK